MDNETLIDMIDRDQIRDYVSLVFGCAPADKSLCVNARLIGEKGTVAEGRAPRNLFRLYDGIEETTDWLYEAALGAAECQQGVFVLPGFLSESAAEVQKAGTHNIHGFGNVCLDIDTGDTEELLEAASEQLGEPSMVVWSGGVTDSGAPKMHLYWELDGLTDDWEGVGKVREAMALAFGGDAAFKRPTQVIRVPGTLHQKGGKTSLCMIESRQNAVGHPLGELVKKFKHHPASSATSFWGDSKKKSAGISALSGAGKDHHDNSAAITNITEGGSDVKNRWSSFSEVAGHYVHQARIGTLSITDAMHMTHGWMIAHMVPPWPEDRFKREWDGIVSADISNYGAFPIQEQSAIKRQDFTTELMNEWRIGAFAQVRPEPRKWIVENLVLAGKRQMLAAAGGAGKSYAMLQLGMMVAATSAGKPGLEWFGNKINSEEAGTVVIISCEDDKEEVTRRLHELDPHGELRRAAGNNLIVLPTDNLGGSFPLVTYDRRGLPTYSDPWSRTLSAFKELVDGGEKIALVVIDTLNAVLHGDENSAQIAGEFISAVSPITGQLGAALIVTHHTRKGGHDEAMSSEKIRGTNALTNGMRNVLAISESPDYEEILRALGMAVQTKELFELSVVKGNVSGLMREPRYLLRSQEYGFLEDVTDAVKKALATMEADKKTSERERRAWLLFAIRWAADQGLPYSMTGENGIASRTGGLNLKVTGGNKSPTMIKGLVSDLKERGDIVTLPPVFDKATGKPAKGRIDVSGGPLAAGEKNYIDTSQPFTPPDYSKFAYDFKKDAVFPVERVEIGGRLHQTMTNLQNTGHEDDD